MKAPVVKVSGGGNMTARVLLNGQTGKVLNSASKNTQTVALTSLYLNFVHQ